MHANFSKPSLVAVLLWMLPLFTQAQTPVTLADVPGKLEKITPDEAIASEFSPEKAARYLDRASLNWQKKKKCATCHTNMSYMMARPALGAVLKDSGEVRAFFEDYPNVRWKTNGPSEKRGFWPIVVGTGLTFNDLQTTGKLSDAARDVLDMMWTVQRDDGGWNWPHCDYAPMEIDDHFGATLAALTVGIAPDGYAETPAAKAGLKKLRAYFKNDPPKSLHHRAMLAWSSVRIEGIATDAEREKTLAELMALQLPDGGWSTSGFLTDWKGGLKREDGKPLDTKTSDGYGTGLVMVIARDLGVPANDPRLQKAITWLKTNQREGGKWFTRSPVVDANNLISNTGTAYAILGLQACGVFPNSPFGKESKASTPFDNHGRIRVAKSGTYLEHADETPFFFLADTCWSGPALSEKEDWDLYLADRKKKGFTAIQFNMVSPWRAAPTDAEGRQSYSLKDGQFSINEEFYSQRLDARFKAINDAGLLAVPVLCWANTKGDAGIDLSEEQITSLIKFEVERYKDADVLWILAGDNGYNPEQTNQWKRIGRAVFGDGSKALVTTHPSGENWPWKDWQNEKWLSLLGYQSGHGDSDATLNWIHHGPPANFGKGKAFTRPMINLEPAYEGILGYKHRKPHSDYSVRRAVYWSLLVTPTAGVTYGGHGVWSWHTKPGEPATGHKGNGNAAIWSKAIHLPGAAQMGYARTLFESLPWTKLRPAQDLLDQKNNDAEKFVACSATPDYKTIVAYFPIGAKTIFKRAFPTKGVSMKWFNPSNGKTQPGSLTPPDAKKDWVLVIQSDS